MRDLSIEVLRQCNQRCFHCSSCSDPYAHEIISLDTVRHVAIELLDLGITRVCISGGEPLLHPDISDIIEVIAEQGVETVLYTSGIVGMDPNVMAISDAQARALAKKGLSVVIFNIPADNATTYDAITDTKGRFPMMCESVHAMVSAGVRCEAHFVPMRQNLNEAEGVVYMAQHLGIKRVSFLRLVEHGRALCNSKRLTLTDEQEQGLIKRLSRLQYQYPTYVRIGIPLSGRGGCGKCHAVSGKLYVKFDGTVYGCEAFKYVRAIGLDGIAIEPMSINSTSLKEIVVESEHLRYCMRMRSTYMDGEDVEPCPVQRWLRERESEGINDVG